MNLFLAAGIWLGSWIIIIICHIVCIGWLKDEDEFSRTLAIDYDKEIISDGNNLFATGLIYFLANLLCYYVNQPILHWIALVLLVLFCLPPVWSFCKNIGYYCSRLKYRNLQGISGFFCAFIPLVLALNIYFLCIA